LRSYAEAHGGRYPADPDGYPQALLLLPEDTPWYALTGPGYEGEVLARAKRQGQRLSEDQCGRVYVRGLTLQSNPELVLLFDKIATPGGDHCPHVFRLWASDVRDVLYVDGRHDLVKEAVWPEFARRQIELLVQAGIARAEAERLYAD
jgi:hypothetical protein